jgi:shikimate kinase
MGAGKSSVSHYLEKLTGLPLYDTDQIVAAKFGLPITEIFEQLGSDRFRREETEALRSLPPKIAIIVTGGGIILRKENVALLKQSGAVVLLEGNEATLYERIKDRADRPLLRTADPRATFSELLRERRPLYQAAADVRIDTSALTVEEAANLILKRVDELEPGKND